MARYEASLDKPSAPLISRRLYNALTFGLVTASFLILWGSYAFAVNGGLDVLLAGGLPMLIGFFVVTIAGLVLMSVGKSRQSVPLSLVGLIIFSLTFGVTLSLALTQYDVGTISQAFSITACISGIFLIAGVTFPEFFSRIGGVLVMGLLAVIVVELVATLIFHVDQTFLDYVVIVLFSLFLGYDSYLMSVDAPTVPNAIFYASDIYLDIVNILVRVLEILDRD